MRKRREEALIRLNDSVFPRFFIGATDVNVEIGKPMQTGKTVVKHVVIIRLKCKKIEVKNAAEET